MSTSERRPDRLEQAAAQLRDQERGVTKAARRVLRRTLSAPRRTTYLRLTGDHDHVRVATSAVRTAMVERLHEALVGAAVQKITLRTDGEQLTGVELELVVRFGSYIDDAAHLARTQVALALTELVGATRALPAPPVSVQVVDVTSGDPRLTTSQDE